MNTAKRALAAAELLMVFPAALFLVAAVMRGLQPLQYEPARTAERILYWYAARPHFALGLVFIALPLVVFLSGCAWLWRNWGREARLREAVMQTLAAIRAHLAILLVAIATVAAGGILAIVVGHLITD
jgi:cytochrome b561